MRRPAQCSRCCVKEAGWKPGRQASEKKERQRGEDGGKEREAGRRRRRGGWERIEERRRGKRDTMMDEHGKCGNRPTVVRYRQVGR